ncbi:reverse transcriptase domain-containing protein [Tanacetum coccineum]
MLGEHNITYRPRTSVKGQTLADFLVEKPDEALPDMSMDKAPSSCVDGSGAGLILISPEGMEFTYALRFQFTASNNEAEYEALIVGLRIAIQMGESNMHPWLRCVGPLQADYVIREIHEGSCSMHVGPRSVVAKAMRLRYYWPTVEFDRTP